jgi:hypothetical protein|tara:strand:+ start:23321 stop:23512 length:192 start_codon:yes stop_codon:yes gene_type:complete
MSDQQYPPDDHAHWGLSTASIDEMPPEDFEVDYTDGFDFSLKNLMIMFGVGLIIIFMMFVVLS